MLDPSTMLNEFVSPSDAIGLHMAHLAKNIVRGIYNNTRLKYVRTNMMQE